MSTEAGVVHGLRAAARLSGWSASGNQKMVDAGRVPAERDGRSYSFRIVDLEAIRRSQARPGEPAFVAASSKALAPASAVGPVLATMVIHAKRRKNFVGGPR